VATTSEIATLRRMTALDEDDAVYTESLLGGMIDDLGMDAAATQVWREKAASVAGLVDTTESGSSRALSGLRKGYLEMATASGASEETTGKTRSFTLEIERA
jgi:hypothetical protein